MEIKYDRYERQDIADIMDEISRDEDIGHEITTALIVLAGRLLHWRRLGIWPDIPANLQSVIDDFDSIVSQHGLQIVYPSRDYEPWEHPKEASHD